MRERESRSVRRRIIAAKLDQFYRLLLAQFSRGSLFAARGTFVYAVSIVRGRNGAEQKRHSSNPRVPDHVFACVKCGLSCITRDYIPVSGRPVT